MPPIDPALLRSRTTAIAAQFPNPKAVAAGARSLLEDYADLTHRPSPKVATSAVENQFKTPAPVLRALVAALRELVRRQPADALPVLDAIWQGGSREERRVASELLGHAAAAEPSATLALVQTWLPSLESGASADALAELGLAPLILADPAAYLEQARQWVMSVQRWTRRFGVAVLLPLAKDRTWDNVPGALSVLRLVMTDSDGEVRRATAEVLAHLAPKSPVEIARFLREQAARSNSHTHWIVRNAMTALGPEEQAEIVRALRG